MRERRHRRFLQEMQKCRYNHEVRVWAKGSQKEYGERRGVDCEHMRETGSTTFTVNEVDASWKSAENVGETALLHAVTMKTVAETGVAVADQQKFVALVV